MGCHRSRAVAAWAFVVAFGILGSRPSDAQEPPTAETAGGPPAVGGTPAPPTERAIDPAPAPAAEGAGRPATDTDRASALASPPGPPTDAEKAKAVSTFDELNKAIFALGQPTQFLPTPSGWTVIVPSIPTPPRPGDKPKPPRPYGRVFYENDFRFLDKPGNVYTDPFDVLKRIPLTPDGRVKIDVGGEFRWQGKREHNRRLDGKENDYNLFRERLYGDIWFDDVFRVYLEGIRADSSHQTQKPLIFDVNHGDLLNAFGEIRLFKQETRTLSARFGRQELLFGNQRLVSPLDWVNTRRTFDDVGRLVYRSRSWDLDAFWGRPLIISPNQFDHGAQSRQFYGTYAVYKGIERHTIDLYFLGLSDSDRTTAGRAGFKGNQDVYTLGTRFQGSYKNWLYETENAYQFGNQANLSRSAGMSTTGLGRDFPTTWAKPQLWFYFDYASGDRNPNNGSYGTFNQLFPLGHKYFGYLDIVGRQNILDPNLILTFVPSKRVNFLVWYHHFLLDSATDALYNASGIAIRRDRTGKSGTNVGDEIDLVTNIILTPHSDFQIGYSKFVPGSFIKHTGVGRDSSMFYGQFSYRF